MTVCSYHVTAKWLSVRLRTKWLWVRVPLQLVKLQISCLFRAMSYLTFRQLKSVEAECGCKQSRCL